MQRKCPGARASFFEPSSQPSIHYGIIEMDCRRKISASAELRGICLSPELCRHTSIKSAAP